MRVLDWNPDRPPRLNAERFRERAAAAGLPMTEVARQAGISYASLKRMANGQRPVSPAMAAKLFGVLPHNDIFDQPVEFVQDAPPREDTDRVRLARYLVSRLGPLDTELKFAIIGVLAEPQRGD